MHCPAASTAGAFFIGKASSIVGGCSGKAQTKRDGRIGVGRLRGLGIGRVWAVGACSTSFGVKDATGAEGVPALASEGSSNDCARTSLREGALVAGEGA